MIETVVPTVPSLFFHLMQKMRQQLSPIVRSQIESHLTLDMVIFSLDAGVKHALLHS